MLPQTDPRDPPVTSAGYYQQFRRELATSEHIRTGACYLGHLHYLFEGWGNFPEQPRPEVLKKYAKAMELAVRYCSPQYRAAADTRAADYAENAMEGLLMRLRSCDATLDRQAEIMRDFAGDIIGVFLHHLTIAVGHSRQEWDLFIQGEEQEGIPWTDEDKRYPELVPFKRTTGE